METIKKFENKLLKRQEVEVTFENQSNPGFDDARKRLAEEFKVPEENIAVRAVRGNFGRNVFLVEAFIYDSKEDKERIEPKPKVKAGAK